MLNDVLKIVSRRDIIVIGILLLPLAVMEILTLAGIRMFFVTLNSGVPRDAARQEAQILSNEIGSLDAVVIVSLGLIAFLVLRGAASHLVWTRIIQRITKIQARVLDRLFLRFVSLPMQERLGSTLSEQKHIIMLSAQAMFHQVLYPLSSLLVEGVIAIAIMAALLVLEPIATLSIILWIGVLFGLYLIFLSPKATKAGRDRWQSIHAMRQIIDGAFGDLRWVKITKSESVFHNLFGSQSTRYCDALAKDRALVMVPRYVADVAIVTSIFILFVYFKSTDADSSTLYSGFALFAAAAIRLFPALYRLISLSHSLSTHAPDLGQVVENLKDVKSMVATGPLSPSVQPLFHTSLTFQDLSFKYPGQDRDILSQVSFVLSAGERILITGASGSGKSTLLSLTLGLLDASTGAILLDDENTPLLDKVRGSAVALVSQDPFIKTGTVADNIVFPLPRDTLDDKKAQSLLNGLGLDWALDRDVGENGTHLSGGERQRLAIARALYLSPEFLVLDEATSQMDEVAALRAYELIFQICPDATILICTHQHYLHMFCKRHLKVENGNVVEIKIQAFDEHVT